MDFTQEEYMETKLRLQCINKDIDAMINNWDNMIEEKVNYNNITCEEVYEAERLQIEGAMLNTIVKLVKEREKLTEVVI